MYFNEITQNFIFLQFSCSRLLYNFGILAQGYIGEIAVNFAQFQHFPISILCMITGLCLLSGTDSPLLYDIETA